jgi:hypothetical protein
MRLFIEKNVIEISAILIGAIVSYYFYRKSIREKKPCWAISSNNLIKGFGSKIENLQIKFQNTPVEDLTISKLLFWNNGAETILRDDLKTISPLRIVSQTNSTVLDAKLIEENNISSQLNVELDQQENIALLDFDYLDEGHGGIFQIIHTGTSSNDLSITGDIIGAKKINQRAKTPRIISFLRENIKSTFPFGNKKFLTYYGIITSIFYTAIGLVFFINPKFINILNNPAPNGFIIVVDIVMPIILVLGGIFMFFISYGLYKQVNVAPKGLEGFNSDLANGTNQS